MQDIKYKVSIHNSILWEQKLKTLHTCLNCGDCIVFFTSSSEPERFSTAGRNGFNLSWVSLSASNGVDASTENEAAKSTPTKLEKSRLKY